MGKSRLSDRVRLSIVTGVLLLGGTGVAQAQQCVPRQLARENLPSRVTLFNLKDGKITVAKQVPATALSNPLPVQDCNDPTFLGYQDASGLYLIRKSELSQADTCGCVRRSANEAGVPAGGTLPTCKVCP